MDSAEERRREMGRFLRKRREQLARASFGLQPVGRNRLDGLRREEVAYHAGVSVTWYTWLEQGRDINPSRQVLDAVARTLRLSLTEHHYLLVLAGYAPTSQEEFQPEATAPPHLLRLLDAQGESPAFAISARWDIAGWNRAYEALYPSVATVPPEERNLLAIIFTDPYVRRLLPDWEVTSGRFLAEYRAEAGPLLGHPAHAALVTRLSDASPEFARAWNEYRIERFASRERRFRHEVLGELVFEHHRLTPSDLPDLHVIIYVPSDASTRESMRRFIETSPR